MAGCEGSSIRNLYSAVILVRDPVRKGFYKIADCLDSCESNSITTYNRSFEAKGRNGIHQTANVVAAADAQVMFIKVW